MPKTGGTPITGTAQVVSLKVRPSQASHLCFEAGGILGELNTQLGASLTAYAFTTLYSTLSSNSSASNPSQPASPDPSLLYYGPSEIQTLVGKNALAALRAEGAKVALSKAINLRQNAFYAKYDSKVSAAIIKKMNDSYSDAQSVKDSKPNRLTQLQNLAGDQVSALKAAYDGDSVRKLTAPLKGVVKTTMSKLNSTATGQSAEADTEALAVVSGDFPVDPKPKGAQFGEGAINITNDSSTNYDFDEGTSQVKTSQTIINTDYGFRVPYRECEAQYERAQISLIDQQFAQFIYNRNFPHLPQVFTNELSNIDGDVYRLQVAYANTMLMSPIAGTVTGIYKNPGDAVRAGEPVIRVENNSTIFVEGTLIYPSLIQPNISTVKITTTLFGSDAGAPYLAGTIVAARGQGQENQWSVVMQCDNPDLLYPLGYNFDYDDTVVTITT
jgi:biotin carboxyl carrier protein